VGKPAHISPRAPGGAAREEVGWSCDGWAPGARQRGLIVARWPPGLGWSGCEPGAGAAARRRAPPHFAEAQAEQELWEELRDHGASLNRALSEALQIHSGPAWHVFRVRGCSLNFVALLPLLILRPCFL
jgi:hypothetical protein